MSASVISSSTTRDADRTDAAKAVNVARHVEDMARRHPDERAIVWPARGGRYRHWTFRELNERTDRCAFELESMGIRRGVRTILMVRPSAEFFAVTFALFKIGAVPVLIDPGMGRKRMAECLALVEAEAFIGVPLAHVFRLLHRAAFGSVRIVVTVGRRWMWRGFSLRKCLRSQTDRVGADSREGIPAAADRPAEVGARKDFRTSVNMGARRDSRSSEAVPLRFAPRDTAEGGCATSPDTAEGGCATSMSSCTTAATGEDDPAAIIFTTGSTGPAKPVLYHHGAFDAQVRLLREQFGIQPGEIDLATFPLFALFDPALGMTAVIPDMDFARPGSVDPLKIIVPIRDLSITHMFGSPALLDRVGRYGQAHGVTLPSLRRVISAGAAVPPATLERFGAMLKRDAEIFTPYGATEALPVASIDSREILTETRDATDQGRGTCVGRPVGGVTVRVIRISDEPIERWSDDLALPTGEIGEIVVHGPVVTREYINHPEANALAKIRGANGVWHRMGDVGWMDEQGRLWFCGRKAHRVVTEHGTLFTEPVEAIFNRLPGIRRTALVGVGRRPRQKPVICFELEEGALRASGGELPDQLGDELMQLASTHESTKQIDTFLWHSQFPVDIRHNSKVFREKLAVWATERLRSAPAGK